jgi:hypothetical protein
VGDFNSLASKTSSNNSLNHQSQQIVQDSSVIELQNSNLSGIDSKKDNVSCEETDFVGVQNIKSSVYI